ncbi:MAG: hypothetical protein SR1Q7_10735 [Quinella sp. 1Q7]|nr:hypothetical protein [Quinella sp. 1Q7]
MSDTKTKDFNEYLMESVQAARNETRETKQDLGKRMDELGKRMDRIESRMDKLEDKIDKLSDKLDASMKEMRDLVAQSQKDIRSTTQHSQILTMTVISIVVVVISTFLTH